MKNTYSVSERTATMAKAIHEYENAKRTILTAFISIYGETSGQDLFNHIPFKYLDDELKTCLFESVSEALMDSEGKSL